MDKENPTPEQRLITSQSRVSLPNQRMTSMVTKATSLKKKESTPFYIEVSFECQEDSSGEREKRDESKESDLESDKDLEEEEEND